jgi:hypothetical protein
LVIAVSVLFGISPALAADAPTSGTLRVLFVGNSYTGRNNLAELVKSMAEAGNPGLKVEVTPVTYGGRRLVDHWRLRTQNFVKITTLTADEEKATIKSLQETIDKDPKDNYAKSAFYKHQQLLKSLDSTPQKWDYVVLQSYQDDLDGEKSLYVEFAPRFAELIKAQGGRVILYETTPRTQNAKPLTAAPDSAPVLQKEAVIAALAKRIDAAVAPMSIIALRCQTQRPDLTLRYVNDGHLNQTMGYLTGCAIYAAMFDRSPVGLPIDRVTDTKPLDPEHKDLDQNGDPLVRKFSDKDRADLQRIAWEGIQQFKELAASTGSAK